MQGRCARDRGPSGVSWRGDAGGGLQRPLRRCVQVGEFGFDVGLFVPKYFLRTRAFVVLFLGI